MSRVWIEECLYAELHTNIKQKGLAENRAFLINALLRWYNVLCASVLQFIKTKNRKTGRNRARRLVTI